MLHVLPVTAKRLSEIFCNDAKAVVSFSPVCLYVKVKGKEVIPLQARCGPEGG